MNPISYFLYFVQFVTGLGLLKQIGTSSAPKLIDISLVIPLVLFFFITHRMYIPIFVSFGTKLLEYNSGKEFAAKSEERMIIFANRLYSGIYHTVVNIVCFLFFNQERWWFFNTFIVGLISPRDVRYDFRIKLYYNIELGYVVFKSISLIHQRLCNGIKKEFGVMFFHHFLTFGLITFSFFSGYAYFGILVFFVHNFSDTFTYMCRCCNSVKSKWTIVFLPLMTLMWIIFRLVVFPIAIIGPAMYAIDSRFFYFHSLFWGPFLISLMVLLFFLHTYWVYGMLRINHNVFTSGYNKLSVSKPSVKEPVLRPMKHGNGMV